LLTADTPADVERGERTLIAFIAHEMGILELAPGTVRNKVYAVRFVHMANGAGDILLKFPRMKLVMSSLKRKAGATARKLPAGVEVLEAIAGMLKLGQWGETPQARDLTVWARICTAYFFLLRNQEAQDLRPMDVRPRRGGAYVARWGDEDEVAVFLGSSKVDQLNAGCIRTQSRAGGLLCPSASVRAMLREKPHLLDEDYAGPLFSHDGVNPISREEIQKWLRWGATKVGIDASRVGTHSLRVGGATALYSLGWSFGRIQRFGRWKSEAFHGYLWDSHGMEGEAAMGMATVKPKLHAGILAANPGTRKDARRDNSQWHKAWSSLPLVAR